MASECFYEALVDARAFYFSLESTRLVYFLEDGCKVCGKATVVFKRLITSTDGHLQLLFLISRLDHNKQLELCLENGLRYDLTRLEAISPRELDGSVDCCNILCMDDINVFMNHYYW